MSWKTCLNNAVVSGRSTVLDIRNTFIYTTCCIQISGLSIYAQGTSLKWETCESLDCNLDRLSTCYCGVSWCKRNQSQSSMKATSSAALPSIIRCSELTPLSYNHLDSEHGGPVYSRTMPHARASFHCFGSVQAVQCAPSQPRCKNYILGME
jgi:hypothetical protein